MCAFCKYGTLTKRTTTHAVNDKDSVIIIKNVPCEECEQCGARYYKDDIAEKLEKMLELVKQAEQEIAVLDYNKVALTKEKSWITVDNA